MNTRLLSPPAAEPFVDSLLENRELRKLVDDLERLPAMQETRADLLEAARDPSAGLARVSAIVQSDPAMSAKVMQLVSAPPFGCVLKVETVDQAVRCLGLEAMKGLALSTQMFAAAEGLPLQDIARTSMLAARMARRFLTDRQRAEIALTAALLHDVGTIVLAAGAPAAFAEVMRTVRDTGVPQHVAEQRKFGATHAEVGAYLLGTWGLPLSIVCAIAWHHDLAGVPRGPLDILAAVHAADELATDGPDAALDTEFLKRAGFGPQIRRWRDIAVEELSA